MEDLGSLVARARDGNVDAFSELVGRFQDMAYGYAYSLLGDFHLAEDAAQESFVKAYLSLPGLREPAAFASWFRRIVFTQCHRLTRGKRVPTVPLAGASEVSDVAAEPSQAAQAREAAEAVLEAVRSLPVGERAVTTLFYINGYSQPQIAEFLELPVSRVKNRLHASRKRLKERIVDMAGDAFDQHRLPPDFRRRTLEQAFMARDVDAVIVGMLPLREDLLRLRRKRQPPGSERLFELLKDHEGWMEVLRRLQGDEVSVVLDLIPDKARLIAEVLELIRKHPAAARARSPISGFTLLHLALLRLEGEEARLANEVFKALLDNGADVNARTTGEGGSTPLFNAAAYGNTAAAEILLDHGADPSIKNARGYAPLHVAAGHGWVDVVKLLLGRGVDVNSRTDAGQTPLHVAAGAGQMTPMRLLLDRGAEVNCADHKGHSPLHAAAGYGQVEALELLLDRGADPCPATEAGGNTPLHVAAGYGQVKTLRALLDRGVKVDIRSATGHTPLHVAAWTGRKEAVEYLLGRGADINATDPDGKTPSILAKEKGRKRIVKLLGKRSRKKR